MANFSVSVISLLNGIGLGGAPATPAASNENDGFSALLDIGSPKADESGSRNGNTATVLGRSDDQEEEAVSPDVDVPSDVFVRSKLQSRRDDHARDSDDVIPAPKQNASTQAPADENNVSDNAQEKDGAVAAPGVSDTDGDTENSAQTKNLADELEKIRQILAALLQALLGQMNPVQQATAVTVTQVSATVAVSAGTDAGAANGQLIQDIRNALRNIDDILQQIASPAAADSGSEAKGGFTSFFAQLKMTIGTLLQGARVQDQGDSDQPTDAQVGELLAKLDQVIKQVGAAQGESQKSASASERGADILSLLPDKASGSAPVVQTAATDSAVQVQSDARQSAASVVASAQSATGGSTGNNSGNTSSNSGGGDKPAAPVISINGAGAASSAERVAGSDFLRTLTQASRASVTEQVVFHVRSALQDGSSKIHIQLDPAELGKLDITLDVSANGKTGVVVTADNKQTLDLLQRDSGSLMRALADAGLTTDSGSLSFNLRGGQQEQGEYSQASSTYKKALPDDGEELVADVITRSYVVNLAEGLDIRI